MQYSNECIHIKLIRILSKALKLPDPSIRVKLSQVLLLLSFNLLRIVISLLHLFIEVYIYTLIK